MLYGTVLYLTDLTLLRFCANECWRFVLRESDEATISWQPLVRPDPWLNYVGSCGELTKVVMKLPIDSRESPSPSHPIYKYPSELYATYTSNINETVTDTKENRIRFYFPCRYRQLSLTRHILPSL